MIVLIISCCCCRQNCCKGSDAFVSPPTTEEQRLQAVALRLSTNPPRSLLRTVCREGHPLIRIRAHNAPGQYQICNSCGERYSLSSGSWRCPSCDFDICTSCKHVTQRPGLHFPSCHAGHPLVKSHYASERASGYYFSGYYQCASCFLIKTCIEGRYFCPFCLVDVCSSCQAQPPNPTNQPIPYGNIAAPMPITVSVLPGLSQNRSPGPGPGRGPALAPPPPTGVPVKMPLDPSHNDMGCPPQPLTRVLVSPMSSPCPNPAPAPDSVSCAGIGPGKNQDGMGSHTASMKRPLHEDQIPYGVVYQGEPGYQQSQMPASANV